MKLCFINSCRGATDEFWKKAFAYIIDHNIDTVVVRLQQNALFGQNGRMKEINIHKYAFSF